MPREKVIVKSAWPRFRAAMYEAVVAGVTQGSEVGARESAALAPIGNDVDEGVLAGSHLRDTYDVVIGSKSRRGYSGGYGSSDPNALWQELGTHGRRTRKARRAKNEIRRKFYRQEKSGRSVGVKAKRIMLRSSKPALAATIAGIRTTFGARRFRGV